MLAITRFVALAALVLAFCLNSAVATPPLPGEAHLLRAPRRARAFGTPSLRFGQNHHHREARRSPTKLSALPVAPSPSSAAPGTSRSRASPPDPVVSSADIPPRLPSTEASETTQVTVLDFELTIPVKLINGGNPTVVDNDDDDDDDDDGGEDGGQDERDGEDGGGESDYKGDEGDDGGGLGGWSGRGW